MAGRVRRNCRQLNALEHPDQAEFYTSGRASNEAAFLYQLFARQPFPAAQCVVTSKENVLAIALTVPDEETASLLENVVAEHLKRFAFRESLEIVWQRA